MSGPTFSSNGIGPRAKPGAMLAGLLVCGLTLLLGAGSASAAIPAGIACSSCHSMHNSQDGSEVFAGGPQEALLNNDCIGCHTGQNQANGDYPFVFNSGGATYGTDTLAGGNFYWVTQLNGDAKGHNVEGIAAIDGSLDAPPGFNASFNLNGAIAGGSWGTTERLTCAGTNGCHGRHVADDLSAITSMTAAVKGGHHGDDATIDGSTVAKSYRFLYGIIGIEDPDREFTASDNSTDHNQYHGVDSDGGTDQRTISYLCAECHGTFHADKGTGSPWLRHPTDFDMGNVKSKEYGGYNGGTSASAPYSIITPVASNLDTVTGVQATVFDQADDAIVTCVSCHRAHGTPYYKLMRWDYANSIGGACTNCHTSKN